MPQMWAFLEADIHITMTPNNRDDPTIQGDYSARVVDFIDSDLCFLPRIPVAMPILSDLKLPKQN